MKSEYGTGEVILLQTLDYFRKKVEALEGETYRADEPDIVCYNNLYEDYVEKCAEHDALAVSYNKLAEVAEAEIEKLKKEVKDWQDKFEDSISKDEINSNYIKNLEVEVVKLKKEIIDHEKENDEYAKDFSELNRKYQSLKKEKENATWEWSLLKTEKNDAESRYIDMKNNMEDLVKEYDNLYEENIKLKQALDMRMTECDKLKSEIISLKNQINFEKEYEATWGKVDMVNIVDAVCGDLNKATTPISSEEADVLTYMTGWEKAGY